MNTIAALNFGLVIAVTIRSLGVGNKKSVMSIRYKGQVLWLEVFCQQCI